MFVNLSNKPSSKWSVGQRKAALALAGDDIIVDREPPVILPDTTDEEIAGHISTLEIILLEYAVNHSKTKKLYVTVDAEQVFTSGLIKAVSVDAMAFDKLSRITFVFPFYDKKKFIRFCSI